MKYILIIVCCINMQILHAQNTYKKKSVDERAQKFTTDIADYVSGVTDSQRVKLLAINKTTTIQFDSLKNLKLESEAYRPAARGIFKQRDASIKLLFTIKQYDEFMMQQAEKREESFKKKQLQKQADSSKVNK
jgi:hypothetical protein